MRGRMIEEPVTVLTDGERIDGTIVHMDTIRLSDFLNSALGTEERFLKVKDPKITDRRSGEVVLNAPFFLVARERVVGIVAHVEVARDSLARHEAL